MSSSPQKSLSVRPLLDLTKERYLNYAMSVIMSRALPDVRDGLKPVQRRVLYAMFNDLKLYPDKKHRKSAAVVGRCLGSYHPHSDVALYEAMVRMAQDWVLRVPLVDGHGNFGNIDGDGAAAMRYTEARLRTAGEDMMAEIRRDVVDFRPNFDATAQEPEVLPTQVPTLLINGASGIAVGMATNIPPHNPVEILNAAIDLLKNPSRKVSTLVDKHVKGPDFPTGGSIVESQEDITKIYEEGRGSVTVRAKWEVEKKGRKSYLVVTEIPYGVQKQDLVEKIAGHIVDNSIPQVVDIRDESTSDIRVVMELKNGVEVENVMAYLFKHTPLESKFHVNLTCLAPSDQDPEKIEPKRLDLKAMLQHFIDFRLQIVKRRTKFDLDKLEDRIHTLEGFVTVLGDAQKAIDIVTKAGSKTEARDSLIKEFGIDEDQTEKVLNTKVYRFAGYEVKAFEDELSEKTKEAGELRALLADADEQVKVVIKELREMRKRYDSERKTLVEEALPEFEYDESAFIEELPAKIIVSRKGWVRRQKSYTDVSSLRVRDGDEIGWVISSNTKDTVAFFTSAAQVYTMRVDDLPDTTGYGDAIQATFSFEDGETIEHVMTFDADGPDGDATLLVVSDEGNALRINPSAFSEPSTVNGRKVMRLDDGQKVIAYTMVEDEDEDHVVVITRMGFGTAFLSKYVKEVKGAGKGVRCINMTSTPGDSVLAAGVSSGTQGGGVTVVTSKGTEESYRHTSLKVVPRGKMGEQLKSRVTFVSVIKEVVEL